MTETSKDPSGDGSAHGALEEQEVIIEVHGLLSVKLKKGLPGDSDLMGPVLDINHGLLLVGNNKHLKVLGGLVVFERGTDLKLNEAGVSVQSLLSGDGSAHAGEKECGGDAAPQIEKSAEASDNNQVTGFPAKDEGQSLGGPEHAVQPQPSGEFHCAAAVD